jgi:ubiquitin carboxyl-terminal hydrolase 36/42
MGKARDSKKAQAAADAAAAAKAALVALSSEGELTPPARLLYPYDAYERFHAYDQLTDPPCGLTNCGNSCFGAAALNCLAFTRPMVAFCLRKPGQPSGAPDHTEATCGEPGWCFLCQLQRHVKKAMGRKTAFAPVDIVSKVRQLGRHLSFGAEVRLFTSPALRCAVCTHPA